MNAHAGGVDVPRVRRALLRALVLSVVSLPAGLLGGERVFFFVLALCFATVPMSLAELALPDRRRAAVLWDVVALLGAFLLVIAAAFEAAYLQGVYQDQSVSAALKEIEDSFRAVIERHNTLGEIGTVLRFVFALGIAVPLWAPFAARRHTHGYDDHFLFMGLALFHAVAGAVIAELLVAIVLCVVFHETPVFLVFLYSATIMALAATPSGLLIPIGYTAADALERRLFRR